MLFDKIYINAHNNKKIKKKNQMNSLNQMNFLYIYDANIKMIDSCIHKYVGHILLFLIFRCLKDHNDEINKANERICEQFTEVYNHTVNSANKVSTN